MLLIAGAVLAVLGLLVLLLPRLPFLGKLPGDILIKKEKFVFCFPIMTSIVVSILLSILLWIFRSK
jgi:hypothetical protein